MILLERLLSGDQGCTWQGWTNEDHGQSENRMGSTKQPDGHWTQSGEETWKELYRVLFPGSAAEEVTLEGQRQPNLRAFTTHRKDWECLLRSLIGLRWVIGRFKTFKSAGNALLQQGVDLCNDSPVPYLYSLSSKRVYTQGLKAGQGEVYP